MQQRVAGNNSGILVFCSVSKSKLEAMGISVMRANQHRIGVTQTGVTWAKMTWKTGQFAPQEKITVINKIGDLAGIMFAVQGKTQSQRL